MRPTNFTGNIALSVPARATPNGFRFADHGSLLCRLGLGSRWLQHLRGLGLESIRDPSSSSFSGLLTRDNCACDLLDLGRGSAGDKNVMTLPGNATTGSRTQTLLGADADDNRGGFADEVTRRFLIIVSHPH